MTRTVYILDRYVHVELGVDKRLNIREMLGRQIAAEVHLHLASPHYRDHLLHVIDVFLLGHLILNTNVYWIDREEQPLVRHLSRINAEGKNEDHSLAMKKSWLRNWAAASLLHDIGYQLGHGRHTSKEPEVWKAYFSLASTDGLKAHYLNLETGSDEDSLKACKAFLEELYGTVHKLKVPGRSLLPPLRETILTDHGVLSALRVSQVLLHADNQNSMEDGKLTKELIEAYTLAIHAISHHNLHPVRVCLNENPLAVLLRLCDELQEWDRRRVNVERVIKGLYLDIQENAGENLPGHDLLETFCANITIEPSDDRCNGPLRLELRKRERDGKRPWFNFCLRYRDAVTAQFDPSLTLLEKSYCFQNIDLSLDSQKQNEIKVMVEMQFPVPKAYNEMLEYDIYGMFTEEARDFPLLGKEADINQSPAGLVKLIDKEDKNGRTLENFGIILQQKSEARLGLLPVDPGQCRDRFISFKNRLLSHMVTS